MLLLSMCDSCTGSTLSTSFYRRCTSSSPQIHICYLRTCISLSKLDNANHGILIAIVHPLQVRTWCCISCLTSMRKMIVLLLIYYPNREAQVLPTKVTSYCEPLNSLLIIFKCLSLDFYKWNSHSRNRTYHDLCVRQTFYR